jgi:putative ABC transport system permease protein
MSISSFVRPAWRSLRRAPAFTVTAATTLVIGIAAAIAIFALVNGVLLRPLPYGFGIAAGLVLFALVARFLRTLLFGVAPTDWLTLSSASLLLVTIASLASWVPARRTARLDPADVLRAE